MKTKKLKIDKIPAILWGEPSDKIYLYVHGKGGSKEEASSFAAIAVKNNWQVLSIDLPEHGDRKNEQNTFYPWNAVPELKQILGYIRQYWHRTSLFANSIGAWFSLLSFGDEQFENCLLVSPILNMERLIGNMMLWADVTEKNLFEQQRIPTDFGETLSWDYLCYAKQHNITKWNTPTKILYAEKDNLTEYSVVHAFATQFNCNLKVMKKADHWFHTPEQLSFLQNWLNVNLKS